MTFFKKLLSSRRKDIENGEREPPQNIGAPEISDNALSINLDALHSTSASVAASGPPATPWSRRSRSSTDITVTDSKPPSLHPLTNGFGPASSPQIYEMKCKVMAAFINAQQEEKLWTDGDKDEGVLLKLSRGRYAACPEDLEHGGQSLYAGVAALNVRAAMTVNHRMIALLLKHTGMSYVEIQHGLRVQVLPDMTYLSRAQKNQFAAFIKDRSILVVWDDTPKNLLTRAENIMNALMHMIWNEGEYVDEKKPSLDMSSYDPDDPEAMKEVKPRRIVLIQPVLTAGTIILVLAAVGSGWRQIAIQTYVDHNWYRFAFIGVILPQMWLALFFFQALIGNVAQICGPISQMTMNTKFYSGLPPRRLYRDCMPHNRLPHVTIQMPVYKEGLDAVIMPTVFSLKMAMSTYEMQGGTANIFINDDGMQLLPEAQARARQDFYDEHNIGWVARPAHGSAPSDNSQQPFQRRGKFKKASNMNYGLWVSTRVEEKLAAVPRGEQWNQIDENRAYREALSQIVQEDQGRTWAEGNIRMGDYILLVDSDTRVPTDCLLDAVSEMEESPQVAILQYSSGVMNVTDSFFEQGITFFTNLVYCQIEYAVSNGDVAPFVGHNAILRWTALQEVGYFCQDDNREKFWSEKTVSEDFDMALRLQTLGYHVRLGAYTKLGFKEGVSLTVYDELARWEKYAYGCNELIFHPIWRWPTRGIFTKLFLNFITSGMPLPSKLTILSYIGTYYALGSAWLFTLVNYFLIGWYNGYVDHYYVDSFKIYFAIIAVFTALGNVALAVLRYRIEKMSFFAAFWENMKWIPLLIVFLGGVSMHISQAILCHMFEVDVSWGATSKEAENISFFEEIPRVIRKFRWSFSFCIGSFIMMIVFAKALPEMWRVTVFTAIWPLTSVTVCHFLMPIVLNPNLMLFTW